MKIYSIKLFGKLFKHYNAKMEKKLWNMPSSPHEHYVVRKEKSLCLFFSDLKLGQRWDQRNFAYL